jgi:hypothetical protein
VLIAGGGIAPRKALLVLRAPAGGRLQVTISAADLKFITRSIFGGKAFSPQRALGLFDVTAHARQLAPDAARLPVVEGQASFITRNEKGNQIMLRAHLKSQGQIVVEDPTQGRQGGQQPGEDPTQGGQGGQRPGGGPTQVRQGGRRPGEDPTQGRQGAQRPGEDPTQGRQGGQRPGEDPTQGRQDGQRPGEDPMGGR